MNGNALIVGGGIAGLSSAWYLRKTGWNVSVLDKGDFLDNCSYGNAGMIVPSHFTPMAAPGIVSQGIRWMFNSRSPFYVKPVPSASLISWGLKFMKNANERHVNTSAPPLRDLNLYSSTLYDELYRDLDESFELKKKGILMLYKTARTQEEEIHLAHTAQELGLDVEVIDRAQLAVLEPELRLDVLGAVHYKCDGHLYPPALITALRKKLESVGVRFYAHEEVIDVSRSQGRITSIETGSGKKFSADRYVFAAGAWLQQLCKKAGLSVPVMPGKGYSFMTGAFEGKVQHPALLLEARVALTPMNGQVRIGGTMELAAVNHKINLNRVEGIVRSVPQYYPEFQLPMPEEKDIWHGFRPCSADGLPYLGNSAKLENLTIAGGLGMMGLSLGPAVGKTVADLINNTRTGTDIRLFDPERFN
ncbi:MAG: FAD-dependent oxidoreductase [Leadbetterella sp.]|nr:FAD-dependent oxidoreductase [Leadbetterella sp.]